MAERALNNTAALTTRARRNRVLLVALAGLLSAASLVNAFAVEYEPAQPVLVKPTFWGDEACSGPLAIFGFPGPFVASRFDPDACDLTSEQQDVYDPAASSFVLTEGVCTNLCKLPTAITISDERLPDENLPHSYKFTCTNNCEGQLAWYIGSDDCDESKIPLLIPGALDIKEGEAETLRTFTFDGDSACFMSSALYSTLGLGSLEMTYVGDARCPCE